MKGRKKQIKPGPQQLKIGVRLETMQKVKGIAKRQRWTLVETVDALADVFLERIQQVPAGVMGEAVGSGRDTSA